MKKNWMDKVLNKIHLSKFVKFAEEKAGERTIYTPADTFGFGEEVYELDEEGNKVPLLDGEYTFDNGVKIVVTDGKISEFIEPNGDEENFNEEDKIEDVKEDAEDKISDVIQALTDEILGIKEEFATMKANFEAMIEKKDELELKLSKTPSVKSVKRDVISSSRKSNDYNIDELAKSIYKRVG